MKQIVVVIALSGLLAGCATNKEDSAGTVTGLRVRSDSEVIGTDRGSRGTGPDTGIGTSDGDAVGGTGTLDRRTTGSGSDVSTGTGIVTPGPGTSGAPASGTSRSGVR